MAYFLNKYEYDEKKLEDINDRIEENEDNLEDINDQVEDLTGNVDQYKVCSICGKLIKKSYMGMGANCYKTLKKFSPILARISPEFAEEQKKHAFKVWEVYTDILKNLYIQKYENKNLKSSFKKSFLESMKKTKFLSKKQAEVIINDFMNTGMPLIPENINPSYKLEMIGYFEPEKGKKITENYNKLIYSKNGLVEFTRITYKKAWKNRILD